MRIFNAFMIIFCATILFMLPFTSLSEDFRTDTRDDEYYYQTGVGETTGNVTLVKPIYDDDTTSVSIVSDVSADDPQYSSYNSTTQRLTFIGLAASENHTLTISYLVDAFDENTTLNSLMDWFPFIWYLIIIAFAPAAFIALFTGRS